MNEQMEIKMNKIVSFLFSFILGCLVAVFFIYGYKHHQREVELMQSRMPEDCTVRIDSTNLPIVCIETCDKPIKKDEYVIGKMIIISNEEGSLNYYDTINYPNQIIDYCGDVKIKYRGHTSYKISPKKSFAIRPLGAKGKKKRVSLLGMKEGKKWALIAGYQDRSMIRDVLTYDLARPYFDFIPQSKLVEVTVNGVYYGIYQLSEQITADRIGLDKPGDDVNDISGGYCLNIDEYDEGATYYSHYLPQDSIGRTGGRPIAYMVDFPDKDKITTKQKLYIQDALARMEQSIMSGNKECYDTIIDVQSFIDYQLVTEISHNQDGYRASTYYYKYKNSRDPRFKMTLWDMNYAYGMACNIVGWRTDTWIYQLNEILVSTNRICVPPYWMKLNETLAYQEQLKNRYLQYRKENFSLSYIDHTIDSLVNLLTSCDAEKRNSQAWPRMWGKNGGGDIFPNKYVAYDFDDEIFYLRKWIEERIKYMDEILLGGSPE